MRRELLSQVELENRGYILDDVFGKVYAARNGQ
jgi:hypothetical protein